MATPPVSSGSSVNSSCAASDLTRPQLFLISIARRCRFPGNRSLQKVHDMNIATEANISGEPLGEKPRKRPVKMLRWFIIVGLLLAVLVGGLVGFNAFRSKMIAQFFAGNKPPPASVSVAEGKTG